MSLELFFALLPGIGAKRLMPLKECLTMERPANSMMSSCSIGDFLDSNL